MRICSGRDKEVICVVRAPKDISAFERRANIPAFTIARTGA